MTFVTSSWWCLRLKLLTLKLGGCWNNKRINCATFAKILRLRYKLNEIEWTIWKFALASCLMVVEDISLMIFRFLNAFLPKKYATLLSGWRIWQFKSWWLNMTYWKIFSDLPSKKFSIISNHFILITGKSCFYFILGSYPINPIILNASASLNI